MVSGLGYMVNGFEGTGYLVSRVLGVRFRRYWGTGYVVSHYPKYSTQIATDLLCQST